jgi:hypothetical protein
MELSTCLFIAPLKDDDTVTRERSETVFEALVTPAALEAGYYPEFCLSGEPGSIFNNIIEKIYNARVLIADLTTGNGSVCYELCAAHLKGIPTVLLIQENHTPPYDLRDMHMIRYSFGDRRALKSALPLLKQQLAVCPPGPFARDNPILNAQKLIDARTRPIQPAQPTRIPLSPTTQQLMLSRRADPPSLNKSLTEALVSQMLGGSDPSERISIGTLMTRMGTYRKS